jgi:hypothetical protein
MVDQGETSGHDPSNWVTAFARALGLEPLTPEAIAVVLDLASVAAHQSQRWAAPVAAYLAGRAGLDPSQALELAQTFDAAPTPPRPRP